MNIKIGMKYQEKYKIRKDDVLMKLPDDKKWRYIGSISVCSFVKHEDENGLHRETNSFSLPYALLSFLSGRNIVRIAITFGGKTYVTSVRDFFEKGKVLFFKGQSERKIYLDRGCFYCTDQVKHAE